MKNIVVVLMIMVVGACKETIPEPNQNPDFTKTKALVGTWDNFQQYWLENTATDMHRTETDDKHRHLSLKISEDKNGLLQAEVREGRNGKDLLETMALSDTVLDEANFEMQGDTVYISGMKHFENKDPYKFIRTRKFSGWIEVPMKQYPDSIYRKSNLEIHDQGGMAELKQLLKLMS